MSEAKKAYHREYNKKWYANPDNAAKKKADAKKHRALSRKRNRDFVREYKSQHPCVKCAEYHPEYVERHPACLHFHHVNGKKETEVSNLVRGMVSIEKLKKEMDKCVVVCANCHARIHEEARLTQR